MKLSSQSFTAMTEADLYGNNIFGGRPLGEFGQAQSDIVGQINNGDLPQYSNYSDLLHEFCGGTNCGK